jgi:thymidine phosphorylase
MVHGLGGPADFLEQPGKYLRAAPVRKAVLVPHDGWLAACDTRAIGVGVIDLGGGRRRPEDRIDHSVGFSDLLPLGTRVAKGDRLATIHAADEAAAERAAATLLASYEMSDETPDLPPVIVANI